MTRYKNPVMKQLADQQVRYAPQPVRLEQIQRAEELIGELSPRAERIGTKTSARS